MAEQHHKSEHVTPQVRKSIVGYRPNGGRPDRTPQITLGGHWLAEVGFATGTPLEIKVLNGCLIITAEEQPEPQQEPEVITQLRSACKKLPPRKQEQIAAFITAVSTPQKRPPRNGKIEWRAV